MAVDRYIKRGGAWVSPPSIYKKKDGAWLIPQLYTKRGGVWINFDAVVPPAPPPAPPTLVAVGDGTVTGTITGAGIATSPAATITASGGVSPYSYSWGYYSGSAVFITSPSSQSTTFANTLAAGQSTNTVVRGRVTDSVGATADIYVTVSLSSGYVALNATVNQSTFEGIGLGAGYVYSRPDTNISVTGGTGAYNYSWAQLSGPSIAVSNYYAAAVFFYAPLNNGATVTAVYRCTVTDTGGQVALVDVTIILTSTYVAPFSAYCNPSEISASNTPTKPFATTGFMAAVPSGGTSPYTYSWAVDNPLINIQTPSVASTKFSATTTASATATCTVTDSLGNVTYAVGTVNITVDI